MTIRGIETGLAGSKNVPARSEGGSGFEKLTLQVKSKKNLCN